jgi:hypothetical protein
VNANAREFLQKLDNLCKEYEFEIVSATDIEICESGGLVGYFPYTVDLNTFRDLSRDVSI